MEYTWQYGGLFLCVILIIYFLVMLFNRLRYIHWDHIVLPPKVLIDEENFPAVVKALKKITYNHHKEVYLDFHNVNEISYQAKMVILALGEKLYLKGKNIYFSSIPKNSNIVTVLLGKNKNHKFFHDNIDLRTVSNSFISKHKLDSFVTLNIEQELKKIQVVDYYELNELITELLGNAVEHGIKEKRISWWMYQYRDFRSKTVNIVFVDMGIGIIESYRKSGISKSSNRYKDHELLLLALRGIIGSSTGVANRGKGLPQINKMVRKKWISDFTLITNRVYLHYNDQEGKFNVKYQGNFVGTYYSFSVNKQNYILWKNRLK